jgi:hypothetical protein
MTVCVGIWRQGLTSFPSAKIKARWSVRIPREVIAQTQPKPLLNFQQFWKSRVPTGVPAHRGQRASTTVADRGEYSRQKIVRQAGHSRYGG